MSVRNRSCTGDRAMKSRCIPIVRHNAGQITWPAVSHIVNLIFLSCKVIAFTLKSTPAQYECGTRLAFRPRLGYGTYCASLLDFELVLNETEQDG